MRTDGRAAALTTVYPTVAPCSPVWNLYATSMTNRRQPERSRSIRYREIAEAIRQRVVSGSYGPGQMLPSESTLSREHQTSRVTIRKALEVLRDDGLLSSRQGAGWFVAIDPLRQSLARLGTIEGQLAASDRSSSREVTGFGFTEAPAWVAEILGCDDVLEVRRRNLADGRPFARVTVWLPPEAGSQISRAQAEASPFAELLAVELGGATQTIGAAIVADDDAAQLEIPAGSPVLVCGRVTRDVAGEPVMVSEHVFPAHLTEFVVDLPQGGRSMSPSGLRLVDTA